MALSHTATKLLPGSKGGPQPRPDRRFQLLLPAALSPPASSAPESVHPRTHSFCCSLLLAGDGTLWCSSVIALTCCRSRWNTELDCSGAGTAS